MLARLESLEQLDMTRVLDRLEDVDLLHHLALGALLLDLVLVCGLDGYELPGQPMQA